MVYTFKPSTATYFPPGIDGEDDDFNADVKSAKLVLTSGEDSATFTLSSAPYKEGQEPKLAVTYEPDNHSNVFKKNNTGEHHGNLMDHVIQHYLENKKGGRRRRSLRRKVSKKMTRRRWMR
jgi:hypothetical protein